MPNKKHTLLSFAVLFNVALNGTYQLRNVYLIFCGEDLNYVSGLLYSVLQASNVLWF